jgi:uncharacterized protein (TIGR02466 family)
MKDDVLLDKLDSYEVAIKALVQQNDTVGDDLLSVKSTHKTYDKLHQEPVFAEFVDEIYKTSTGYLKTLGYSDSFIQKLTIGNMWSNISHANDYIFPHVHKASVLSGAFYVKSYTGSKIIFFNNINDSSTPVPDNENQLSYETCKYDCNPGRLLIFKSDFLHGTPLQTEGEKIVISFNIGLYPYDV